MSNEIQQGLQDDLTTIEPDLMNMTRLFSLPDSVWDAPEYHFAAAIEGGQYVIRFYGKTQAAQGASPSLPSDALRPAAQGNRHSSAVGEHDGHSSDAPDV